MPMPGPTERSWQRLEDAGAEASSRQVGNLEISIFASIDACLLLW